jgi:four helix bundle protein
MELEELKVYNKSMEIGEQIYVLVSRWDYFSKDTIGKQLVRAIDSVAANISDGFGRYHYKDRKKYVFYSRGSLFESKTWIAKAFQRKLISEEEHGSMILEMNILGKMINNYIKSIGTVNEPTEHYGEENDFPND